MNSVRQFAKESLRFALSSIYKEDSVYTVPFGPWRGMRMRYFSSLQYHMILGLYDLQITHKLSKVLIATGRASGKNIYCDLGANIGMYSLWLSRLNPSAKIYAFEPLPQTASRLIDHVSINHVENIEVVPKACSDSNGTISFFVGNGAHELSSLLPDWAANGGKAQKIDVPTTTLDHFFENTAKGDGPDFVKMDIEGGGIFALKGVSKIIERKRPLFMVESHTPEEDRAISNVALDHHYQAYRLNNSAWVKHLNAVHPDPEGVWGTLILFPEEEMPLAKKILP